MKFKEMPAFDNLLKERKVFGGILIYDPAEDMYYGNDKAYSEAGYLPASTFKIANTLVGLSTGVITDEKSMFYWDGEEKALEVWEQDMNLGRAFQVSCVPCYQHLAIEVGVEQMRHWLDQMDYKEMIFGEENLDMFWLMGKSRITPFQQVDFLQRIFKGEVNIEQKNVEILKKIMRVEGKSEHPLYAKSGWSMDGGVNMGWYVGRMEKGKRVLYFATHIQPMDQENIGDFVNHRIELSLEALKLM
ncbi:MAG: penicillin-binding transpeptidase domain-containing protein [Bacteroidota bacterium]